jgi:hypothetical protein
MMQESVGVRRECLYRNCRENTVGEKLFCSVECARYHGREEYGYSSNARDMTLLAEVSAFLNEESESWFTIREVADSLGSSLGSYHRVRHKMVNLFKLGVLKRRKSSQFDNVHEYKVRI